MCQIFRPKTASLAAGVDHRTFLIHNSQNPTLPQFYRQEVHEARLGFLNYSFPRHKIVFRNLIKLFLFFPQNESTRLHLSGLARINRSALPDARYTPVTAG
jgi:hypothetical protein